MARRVRLACWTVTMLVCGALVAACGSSHGTSASLNARKTVSVPKVGLRQSPEEVKGIPVLARGPLPGGGKFVVFLEPSWANKDAFIQYSLMIGTAEPIKYEPSQIPPSHVHKDMVWGGAGGRMVVGREGGAAVTMTTIEGCVGPYPNKIAWGLLKSRLDTVTAYTGGRSISFRVAVLPQQLHAAGVAVYASLPPRSGGRIVTRAPDGTTVNVESLPGRREAVKCSG